MTEWDATKYEGVYEKVEDLGVIAEEGIDDNPDDPLFPNLRIVSRAIFDEPMTIHADETLEYEETLTYDTETGGVTSAIDNVRVTKSLPEAD